MLGRIAIADSDVLVHAGDLSSRGDLRELESQYEILNQLPHEHVIVTPGNHDFEFQGGTNIVRYFAKKYPRVQTLVGESIVVGGLHLWADPWTHWFYAWAFNFSPGEAGDRQAAAHYAMIPESTQLLVTHGAWMRLPSPEHFCK